MAQFSEWYDAVYILLAIDYIEFIQPQTDSSNDEISCDASMTQMAATRNGKCVFWISFAEIPFIHHSELFNLFLALKYVFDIFDRHTHVVVQSDNMLCVSAFNTGHFNWRSIADTVRLSFLAYYCFFKRLRLFVAVVYVQSVHDVVDAFTRLAL